MRTVLGAPVGQTIPETPEVIAFDHAPKLRELLPNGGWPGVVYAQVCVHNVANAAAREENPGKLSPIRGTEYYVIQGPKGEAQMALVGHGKPITGANPDSGERLFFTDGEVERLTGHPVEDYVIWLRAQPQGSKEKGDGEKSKPQGQGTKTGGSTPGQADK